MDGRFIEHMVAAADGLASLYCGVAEDAMMLELSDVCYDLEAGLAEKFGADVAALIVKAFATAVIRRRREIEAGGSMPPPVLN
jgi:hypothetical protein